MFTQSLDTDVWDGFIQDPPSVGTTPTPSNWCTAKQVVEYPVSVPCFGPFWAPVLCHPVNKASGYHHISIKCLNPDLCVGLRTPLLSLGCPRPELSATALQTQGPPLSESTYPCPVSTPAHDNDISTCPPCRELQGCGDLVPSSSDSPSLEQSPASQVRDDHWGS